MEYLKTHARDFSQVRLALAQLAVAMEIDCFDAMADACATELYKHVLQSSQQDFVTGTDTWPAIRTVYDQQATKPLSPQTIEKRAGPRGQNPPEASPSTQQQKSRGIEPARVIPQGPGWLPRGSTPLVVGGPRLGGGEVQIPPVLAGHVVDLHTHLRASLLPGVPQGAPLRRNGTCVTGHVAKRFIDTKTHLLDKLEAQSAKGGRFPSVSLD
jgi:hypothetical protein